MAHANREVIHGAYDAVTRRDLGGYWAFHVPGRSPVAGTYRGGEEGSVAGNHGSQCGARPAEDDRGEQSQVAPRSRGQAVATPPPGAADVGLRRPTSGSRSARQGAGRGYEEV
jgi:hypothetical protein